MRVSSIAAVVAIAALGSSPLLAASSSLTSGAVPTGSSDLVAVSKQATCIDAVTGRSVTSLTKTIRCGRPFASTSQSSCIDSVTGLPIASLVEATPFDAKARKANLKAREAYRRARGANPARLAGAGQTACANPANNLKIASLSQSARAGVATAGGSNFLGAGLIATLFGVTASTAGGVAALATDGGTSPASP